MIIAGLMVAGGAGAVLRYSPTATSRGGPNPFPYGALVINVSGSLVLGFSPEPPFHHGLSAHWVSVLGTRLIGAYTTFSTFSYDSSRLLGRDALGPGTSWLASWPGWAPPSPGWPSPPLI